MNQVSIGSDNGLSPGRCQAIIWTNAGILLIVPLGINVSEILIGINTFSFKKMCLKMSSAKWRPFCPGENELNGECSSCPYLLWRVQTPLLLSQDKWKLTRASKMLLGELAHYDEIPWKNYSYHWGIQGVVTKACLLTRWGSDKMAAILETFSNSLSNFTECVPVPEDLIETKSALVEMAWHWTDKKPLSRPMID